MMEEQKLRKRMRYDVKRWGRNEKKILLQVVLGELGTFEKPTARRYYNKLIEKAPILRPFGWKAMRDKVRNLKVSYFKAVDWRNQTESGVCGEDSERIITEHLLRMCEDFYELHEIFGDKTNSVSPHVKCETLSEEDIQEESFQIRPVEHLTESQTSQSALEDDSFGDVDSRDSEDPKRLSKSSEDFGLSFPSELKKGKIEYLREKLKHEIIVEEKRHQLEVEKFKFHQSMELRKMDLEEKKFAFEKKRMEEEMRIRKIEIENNFELQKFKLQFNFKYNEND